jgi:hypothetical protein
MPDTILLLGHLDPLQFKWSGKELINTNIRAKLSKKIWTDNFVLMFVLTGSSPVQVN